MIENSLKIENYKPRREVGEPTVSSALKILALLVALLVFPFSVSASARLQMPPNYLTTGSGLVGYWTFDGKDTNWGTNKTNDVSGQGNTGTLTNMSTTTSPVVGKIGQGLKFDDVNDYVDLPRAGVTSSGAMTHSFWFKKLDSTDTDYLIGIINGQQGSDHQSIGIKNSGAADQVKCVDVTASVTTGRLRNNLNLWHHVVCAYDGSTETVYLDGVNVGSGAASYTTATEANPRIGSNVDAIGAKFFNGLIDDVRIYNRALSAAEVANLYNIGKAKANVSNAVISNGLVGYWTFDGATTTRSSATAGITGDLSGNFNTGTLTNMNRATSPAIGKIGQGLKFDGVDDYVSAPDSASLSITGDMSVFNWVNFTSTPTSGNRMSMVTKYEDVTPANKRTFDFSLYNNSGTMSLRLIYSPDGVYSASNDAVVAWTPSASTWYNVGFIFNATTKVVKFYVNGVQQGSDYTGAASSLYDSIYNFGLGAKNVGTTPLLFLDGKLDDVRIYNRALSAGEVLNLYNSGKAKANVSNAVISNGLVGYWTFDGATTTWSSATAGITGDLSGNFNTGTLTNMNRATSPVVGKIGQGLKFDGVDDYVNVLNISFAATTTWSAWVKKTSNTGYAAFISATEGGRDYVLRNDVSGTKFDFVWAYSGEGWGDVISPSAYPINQWFNVLVTHDSTTLKMYVNGSLVVSGAATANNPISGINIGRRAYDSAYYFPGLIDDVRIYNRALSASEVLQLYNIGR